jgi:hypothetical protein
MVLVAGNVGEQAVPFVAYSYAIALVSGLPVLLIYELMGLRRLWHYLVGGFVIPFVVGIGLQLTIALEPGRTWERTLMRAAGLASLCVIGASTFWLIAVRPESQD